MAFGKPDAGKPPVRFDEGRSETVIGLVPLQSVRSAYSTIRDTEHQTSGEIRVSISPKHVADPVAAAQAEFLRLGMDKSPGRNGVLIFVAPRAHKFAVIGDEAVHAKCGDAFWQSLAEAMAGYFRKAEFTPGIIHGVQKAGELLAAHFPRK